MCTSLRDYLRIFLKTQLTILTLHNIKFQLSTYFTTIPYCYILRCLWYRVRSLFLSVLLLDTLSLVTYSVYFKASVDATPSPLTRSRNYSLSTLGELFVCRLLPFERQFWEATYLGIRKTGTKLQSSFAYSRNCICDYAFPKSLFYKTFLFYENFNLIRFQVQLDAQKFNIPLSKSW